MSNSKLFSKVSNIEHLTLCGLRPVRPVPDRKYKLRNSTRSSRDSTAGTFSVVAGIIFAHARRTSPRLREWAAASHPSDSKVEADAERPFSLGEGAGRQP